MNKESNTFATMDTNITNGSSFTIKKTVIDYYSGQSYHDYLANTNGHKDLKHKRYVKFSQRTDKCDMSPQGMEQIAQGKYSTSWRGVPLMKCGLDLIAYQHLMWELQPKTIIEMGTARGGSALWLDDTMSAYGLDYHIYTMDIDTEQCHPTAQKAKHVTFKQGDSFKIDQCFTPELLQKCPHPWLVIEDAHMNISAMMNYFHRFLLRGDYFILEDTNPLIEGMYPPGYDGVAKETEEGPIKFCILDFSEAQHLNQVMRKKEQVEDFMKSHDDEYVVDAKIQDMFGMNSSWNMNSTFMKL